MSFMESMRQKARSLKRRIILPETQDKRVILAASELIKQGLCEVHLVGNPHKVDQHSQDLSKAIWHNPDDEALIKNLQAQYFELRKDKGGTWVEAGRHLKKPITLASMLLRENVVDGLVSGSDSPTADVLRAGLQIVKPAKGIKTISSYFIMVSPDKEFGENGLMFFADCGVVPNPTSDQLSDIAISTATNFETLIGAVPRVAFLSFSTKGSASHADVNKVTEGYNLALTRKLPHWEFDGELQADAALVPAVGQKKAPGSKVAGQANILIFPDLDSGNIGYKLVQRFGRAEAYGPMIQGLSRPMNDLSRGCSVEDIINVSVLTAIQV